MSILKVEKVSKQYANHKALNEVSLNVPNGEIFGLLGPNGAGKTTLIRIINQITAPDSGQVYFNDRPLSADDVYKIGYLPEERGLYKKMKVGEQAVYLAKLKGLSRADALHKLKYWFEKFEIQPWWNKKIEELSKGMQQKVQFIVTILHDPELLIFDEPFSGFDPINANLLKQEILNLKKQGTSIIFSTHNMGSVEEICDEIALINKSEKILEGQVQEIKQRFSANNFECSFYGDPYKINDLLAGEFILLEQKSNNGLNYIKVELKAENTKSDLLVRMANHSDVVTFNQVIPTMDDIFIKVVSEDLKK